jgi:hypothetical protein
MKRRRSSYGAHLAHGLYREGCGAKPDMCTDCIEAFLDMSMFEHCPNVSDTFRRVSMRYDMRKPLLSRRVARVAYRGGARR